MGSRFIALMAAVLGVIALAMAGVYFYRPHVASPSVVTGESPSPASGQPKPQSEAKPAESAPLKPTAVPSFDVVRIEPSGEGVIAGRAEPGWSVRVESGSTIVAETRADDQEGAWSIVLDKPLPSGDSLSLRAISPDGTRALTAQQSVPGAVGKASGAAVAQNEPSKNSRASERGSCPGPVRRTTVGDRGAREVRAAVRGHGARLAAAASCA